MATIVASRFAVLSIDDDDDDDGNLYPSRKKKAQNKKMAVKCQNLPTPKSNSKPDNKDIQRKKKKLENPQCPNPRKNKTTEKKEIPIRQNLTTSPLKKELVEREVQLTGDNFEEELSRAILLSKMEYETKKNRQISHKQNEGKLETEKKKKKSQKTNESDNIKSSSFDNVENSNRKISKTEKKKEKSENFDKFYEISRESPIVEKKLNDNNSKESLTLVLYQASIDKKDREIHQLKAEIERLNIQLKNVKIRNTKLCQIIANGEMKDKAEVLMEVERLQIIKDELSNEVANLHTQLEQERSKVRQLMSEHKNKNKKQSAQ